jgi:hypothetical protein
MNVENLTDTHRKLGVGERLDWGDVHVIAGEVRPIPEHWITQGLQVHEDDQMAFFRPLTSPLDDIFGNEWPFTPPEAMTELPTGSKRKSKVNKGRFDLIPYEPMRQLAVHFERGGKEHGDRNWEKGQPLSMYASCGKRHAMQIGCDWSENHVAAANWNFFCLAQTAEWIRQGKLPKELDDIGYLEQAETYQSK